MKNAFVAASLGFMCLISPTLVVSAAQDDASVFGTNSVSFVPLQVGGELRGCTLVYEAVVVAVSAGLQIGVLMCQHFPQVSIPGLLAEHIRTVASGEPR